MRFSRTTGTFGAIVVSTVIAMPALASPTFSTAPKQAADPHPHHLTQLWRVRAGNDGTFDRIVFDQRFSPSGYVVHYVKQVVADASGRPVHVKGHYFLTVSLPDTSTSSAAGTPTNVLQKYTPNLPAVTQIKKTGEFENVVSFGIGLRHKRGFRVERLKSPLRLVIDVQH